MAFSLRKKLALSLTCGLLAIPIPMYANSAHAAGRGDVNLRLLETTDIHTNLVNYDYYTMKNTDTFGFAKTATLIKQQRSGAKNSMLFDNGDLIQGNPLGDYVARVNPLKDGQVHPVYKAMNLLDYDAATLGNHEFNYGLDFLNQTLKGAKFPYVSANLYKDDHDSDPTNDQSYIKPWQILDKEVVDDAGNKHTLKVGVVGFLPPQIMQWDRTNLDGKVITKDIVNTAKISVEEMKKAGADIIVALAHTGSGSKTDYQVGAENAGYALAGVPGIDAILLGHTHTTLKENNYNGVAMVQAGAWGDNLGVIDLKLQQDGSGKWSVLDDQTVSNIYSIYKKENGAVVPNVEADQDIVNAVADEHNGTIQYVQQKVGTTSAQIYSYFAQVQDDPSIQIVTQAQKWYADQKLKGTELEGLPILSAGAPFKLNTNIPAGNITIKDTASLYQFPNTVSVLKMNGAQVKEWLEMAAGQFNQIDPNLTAEQPLINTGFPSYNFDVIDGVTYKIDVTQPAKYSSDGNVVKSDASRIKNLQFNGKPLDLNQQFAVVTNNYRAGGGGNFPAINNNPGLTKINFPDENRQALIDYIKSQGTINPSADKNWSFAPITKNAHVTFTASSDGKNLLKSSDMIRYESETSSPGYAKYAVKLVAEEEAKSPTIKDVKTSYEAKISQAKLSFTINKDAKLTVKVKDQKGKVLTTLLNGVQKKAGSQSVLWNVSRVPNGKYNFEITMEDSSKNKSVSSVPFTLAKPVPRDTTAPVIKKIKTAFDKNANRVLLRYDINEAAMVTIDVKNSKGKTVAALSKNAPKKAGSWWASWDVLKAASGKYTFTITAIDSSHNKRLTSVAYTLEKPAKKMTGKVNVSYLNVRTKPSNYGKVIGHFKKNQVVTVLNKNSSWYKVQYGKATGYVSVKFLSNVH